MIPCDGRGGADVLDWHPDKTWYRADFTLGACGDRGVRAVCRDRPTLAHCRIGQLVTWSPTCPLPPAARVRRAVPPRLLSGRIVCGSTGSASTTDQSRVIAQSSSDGMVPGPRFRSAPPSRSMSATQVLWSTARSASHCWGRLVRRHPRRSTPRTVRPPGQTHSTTPPAPQAAAREGSRPCNRAVLARAILGRAGLAGPGYQLADSGWWRAWVERARRPPHCKRSVIVASARPAPLKSRSRINHHR